MTLKKLLLAIAGGIGVFGAFLPWFKASLFGYTATSNAFSMGALYVVLAILAILVGAILIASNVVSEKQLKKLIKIKDYGKISLCAGIALVVIALIAFIAIQSDAKGFGGASWGVWLMGIAGVCAIILACLKNIASLNKTLGGEKK